FCSSGRWDNYVPLALTRERAAFCCAAGRSVVQNASVVQSRGMKKWYWSGKLSTEERKWPNDGLPPEVEPMPKWVMVCAAVTVALLLAYASYTLIIS
ncbi:MAG TPA: hypothetical protein VHX68_13700, partial [Planctomycetaceae bacterium]|nr:hypothetical protein [Planctomycetaceae bacterium]